MKTFFSIALALLLTTTLHAQQKQQLPAGTDAHRDIAYVPGGGNSQSLDLFIPGNPTKPLPVVVWIHGGAWKAGDKKFCPAMPLLNRGYAVASLNYRLSQEAIFPAQIHDCKAALRWLRANAQKYHLDPNRIGVWGGSAGGHLVALLGTSGGVKELEGDEGNLKYSSRVQAVCDWFGPSDFTSIRSQAADGPVAALLGGIASEAKQKAILASPVTYVNKANPPFLIMHGDKDPTVPFQQSELLYDKLKKAGVDVTFKPVPGAGHGFGGSEIQKQVFDFFDKHLKK